MPQNVIALVCDCDGTLCPDTASLLVKDLGLDPASFWPEVARDVERGWDPPLAWLSRLVTGSRKGEVPAVSRERLKRVGESVELYPGVDDFVARIRQRLNRLMETPR
jgi:hypothetical protein